MPLSFWWVHGAGELLYDEHPFQMTLCVVLEHFPDFASKLATVHPN